MNWIKYNQPKKLDKRRNGVVPQQPPAPVYSAPDPDTRPRKTNSWERMRNPDVFRIQFARRLAHPPRGVRYDRARPWQEGGRGDALTPETPLAARPRPAPRLFASTPKSPAEAQTAESVCGPRSGGSGGGGSGWSELSPLPAGTSTEPSLDATGRSLLFPDTFPGTSGPTPEPAEFHQLYGASSAPRRSPEHHLDHQHRHPDHKHRHQDHHQQHHSDHQQHRSDHQQHRPDHHQQHLSDREYRHDSDDQHRQHHPDQRWQHKHQHHGDRQRQQQVTPDPAWRRAVPDCEPPGPGQAGQCTEDGGGATPPTPPAGRQRQQQGQQGAAADRPGRTDRPCTADTADAGPGRQLKRIIEELLYVPTNTHHTIELKLADPVYWRTVFPQPTGGLFSPAPGAQDKSADQSRTGEGTARADNVKRQTASGSSHGPSGDTVQTSSAGSAPGQRWSGRACHPVVETVPESTGPPREEVLSAEEPLPPGPRGACPADRGSAVGGRRVFDDEWRLIGDAPQHRHPTAHRLNATFGPLPGGDPLNRTFLVPPRGGSSSGGGGESSGGRWLPATPRRQVVELADTAAQTDQPRSVSVSVQTSPAAVTSTTAATSP